MKPKTEIRVENWKLKYKKKMNWKLTKRNYENYENDPTPGPPLNPKPYPFLRSCFVSPGGGNQRRDFRSFLTQGFFHTQEISVATIVVCNFVSEICKGFWFVERGRMAVVAAVPLCASQLAATRRRSLSSEPSASCCYSSAHYSPAVARVNCWRNSFLTSSGLLLLFLLHKKLEP